MSALINYVNTAAIPLAQLPRSTLKIMNVGDQIFVSGYVTKDKFILGRTLEEIEAILGFKKRRLEQGMFVLALDRLPLENEFQLAAYSMIAEHRFSLPTDLNIAKIKENAASSWTLTGGDRLVKVRAVTPHDPNLDLDQQYPPGKGAPQWKLLVRIPATCVASVSGYPAGRYRLAAAFWA